MMHEVVEGFVEIPKTPRKLIQLYSRALLSLELRRNTRGAQRNMMMHDLVKTERSDILADIRPADRPVVRIRLEVPLMRICKLGQCAGVMQPRNCVPNDERLLQLGLECARDDAICNVVTWNNVETRIGIHTSNPQMSCAKQRDERCICRVTVNPSGEGIPPACR